MTRAVATLEIRDASKLTPTQAKALARMITVRKKTAVMKHGPVRAELRVHGAGRAELSRWLAEQGQKLIYDRSKYNDIYTAKLFSAVALSEAA